MSAYSYPLQNESWLPAAHQPSKMDRLKLAFWVFFIQFLVVGYYAASKSFAYFGIPQARVFIGEIFLVLFIASWRSSFFNTWITALVKPGPLTVFAAVHLAFLGYGIFETLRGVDAGYALKDAILNLVFNVYPIYMFVGYWFERKSPGTLERIVEVIALVNGFYGLAYIAVFNNWTNVVIPGTDVPIFGQPGGSMISLLGLIILRKRGLYFSFLMLLNALVLLGTQVRGDWLGFLLGLLVWGALTGNLGQVIKGGVLMTTILAVGLITDVRLPGVSSRGGETSAREMVGRGLSGIDKDAAREFSKDADIYAGTLQWRKNWWVEIWIKTHSDLTSTFLGQGYGFPLASLVTYIGHQTVATRTPHSIFYYALGYSGWIGVILLIALQLSVVRTMWLSYRKADFSLGLAVLVATLTTAMAGNCLETPFGAIPYYSVMGMCAAYQLREPAPDEEELEYEPEPLQAPPYPYSPAGAASDGHRYLGPA